MNVRNKRKFLYWFGYLKNDFQSYGLTNREGRKADLTNECSINDALRHMTKASQNPLRSRASFEFHLDALTLLLNAKDFTSLFRKHSEELLFWRSLSCTSQLTLPDSSPINYSQGLLAYLLSTLTSHQKHERG